MNQPGAARQQLRLAVIVPSYNESASVELVANRLRQLGLLGVQLIFVDDGSTDGTAGVLMALQEDGDEILCLPTNLGKTAAVRHGLRMASADLIVVQDADTEYDPADIERLYSVADQNRAVFGRRPSCWNNPSRWLFASGVLAIDLALLLVYRSFVRDHATCYKLIPRRVLRELDLQSNGFEGCVEITAKLMRSKIPIHQVPISYTSRSYKEGKKLRPSHFFKALAAVWKYRHWTPSSQGTMPISSPRTQLKRDLTTDSSATNLTVEKH